MVFLIFLEFKVSKIVDSFCNKSSTLNKFEWHYYYFVYSGIIDMNTG